MKYDDTRILANDNTLPYVIGQQLDAAAASEVILLSVPELLGAECYGRRVAATPACVPGDLAEACRSYRER